MFNRTTTVNTPAHVGVRVDMPRPDTAEFTRLYGEMVRRAEAEVSAIQVRRYGAIIDVKVLEVTPSQDLAQNAGVLRVKFSVNGELYDTEQFELDVDLRKTLSRGVLQEAIAGIVTREVMRTISGRL